LNRKVRCRSGRAGSIAFATRAFDDMEVSSLPFLTSMASSVQSFSETRLRDHLAGRLAAHRALEWFGAGGTVIARAPDGAPVWPCGFSGSISHVDALGFALVVRGDCHVGVDMERVARVKLVPVSMFACPAEIENCGDGAWAKASIFSIKEAMFKAVAGLLRQGFDPFRFRLLDAEPLPRARLRTRSLVETPSGEVALHGEAVVRDGMVFSVAWRSSRDWSARRRRHAGRAS